MVNSFSWDYWQNLTPEVIDELTFWKINLRSLSGYSFSPSLSQIDVKFEVALDASGVGVFGYLVGDKQVLLKRGFTLEEKKESSTYRELVALRDIYLSDFAVDLKGQVVRHLTDNKAVESIMRIGSSKPKLQDMAISIYKKSRDFNFTLLVEWRSREDPLIKFADEGSRLFDQSSYGLNFESFLYVINYFGHLQLEVDCMAQEENKKCVRYFSRFPDEKAEGRNFFSQHLDSSTIYYCFPPPSIIHPTLLHFLRFQSRGLLLLPLWPSSSYWTIIAPDGVHLGRWCISVLRFQPSGFEVCPAVTSVTFRVGNFEMLAVEFDFMRLQEADLHVSKLDRRNCLKGGCGECR